MTTKSAKAKGRRLQQVVCEALFEAMQGLGDLHPDDIQSRTMGVAGEDIVFSPRAKEVIGDLAIECKSVEKLNVVGVYYDNAKKHPQATPVLVHKKTRRSPLVTISLETFLKLLRSHIGTSKQS